LYDTLSVEELREKLKEQQDLLEEVEEERIMILSQRNIHLPGSTVVKYQNELKEIRDSIDVLNRLIGEKAKN
jgi:hypothetical protein